MSKERPVLFKTAMVKAILKGRKTMTRRIRKLGEVGDVLWVRETFAWNPDYVDGVQAIYKADDCHVDQKWKPSIFMPHSQCRLWLKLTSVRQERLKDISESDAIKEGIFSQPADEIYKSDSRFHWRLLKSHCERGITISYESPIVAFVYLWDSINYKHTKFDANPLVWVHEFTVERF